MTELNASMTVGAMVASRPARSKVFERLGIDYCCGGKKSLAEVCQAKGLDPASVLSELAQADEQAARQAGSQEQKDWSQAGLTELVDHIEKDHHGYVKQALPRLLTLCDKVAGVHGDSNPELLELRTLVHNIAQDMMGHMMKEEQVLFPMMRQLQTATNMPAFHCGSLKNPIGVMEYEHDQAGAILQRMREITANYTLPEHACNSYRALFAGLSEFESDLHNHVHKENNILFPRAVEAESKLSHACKH